MNIPKKVIFLNGMSRNGVSLVHQSLMGHPHIALYPARFKLACSMPPFWPCCEAGIPADRFFDTMLAKHDIEDGENWQSIRVTPLATALEKDVAPFKDAFLYAVRTNTIISPESFSEARHAFMTLVFGWRKQHGYEIPSEATHLLLQDDHAFNAPTWVTDTIFGVDAHYIQIVRSFPDVLASRKALLLRYINWQADPAGKTLRAPVIFSEFVRWLWSLVCAAQNYMAAPDRYTLIGFEAFRHNLDAVARHMATRLGIPYVSSMANPDAGFCTQKKTGLSLLVPTLTTVFPSKISSTRTGSHVHVLNACEMDIMAHMTPWPDAATDALDFAEKLSASFTRHGDEWLRIGTLGYLQKKFLAGESAAGMAHYSAWNHGYGERLTAFV